MNIGIYIYNQAEVLDFSGPFEVFSTAARVCGKPEPFKAFLIGETGDTVLARAGYKVIPDYSITNHPALDVLVIVGGVHTDEMRKTWVIDWISTQAQSAKVTASVCTGAFLLAQAGVVQSGAVTTHWEDADDLQRSFPSLTVIKNKRWVRNGNLITSAGISAGIDMCLYLVGELHGEELALKTARQMDYHWVREE